MRIPERTYKSIHRHLGEDTDAFLLRVQERIARYACLWKLSRIELMPTYTVNLLFACESADYGACVLKLCIPGPEVATEAGCLMAYAGSGYCRLWAYDPSGDALLLERIAPGDTLWAVKDFRQRAFHMATTLKSLPQPEGESGAYPTYGIWMDNVRTDIAARDGCADILPLIDLTISYYGKLRTRHTRDCLLHGDLHQENLLRNGQGGYTVIDPKGVVDIPVMETARFLLNELPCPQTQIMAMIEIICPILGVCEQDMLASLFIDTVLSNCWSLQEHFVTKDAFAKQKEEALILCTFAQGLLDQQSP